MTDPYVGREQTQAKHFILRRYLQALAFKVLTFSDITYIDGFSGPWEAKTTNFSDTSFMIAISVLRDAQGKIFQRDKVRRRIRCFFSDNNPEAFSRLSDAVAPFHTVDEGFEIQTYLGKFEDAIAEIQRAIGNSFPLIFIDPTGWTGYSFDKISPLFNRKCEVLINFMYEFINRFVYSEDPDILRSLEPILGGPNWTDRLDNSLPRGLAVEKLFRETLRSVGKFEFVISTKIDKATADRPHFYITYGTKNRNGLITFRQTEYEALRQHEKNRGRALERKRETQSGIADLFPGGQAQSLEATVDEIVKEEKSLASGDLLGLLNVHGPLRFARVVEMLLEIHMLRETDVKDVCVALAKVRKIENTWGGGNRKPRDEHIIRLAATPS